MSDLLIRGGEVVDPARGFRGLADVLIRGGHVVFCGSPEEGERLGAYSCLKELPDFPVYDATGKVVVPGLIDIHVHLREPGMEEEETIASGTAAAVAGGFTAVACMPNTDPALDSEAHMNFVNREARMAGMAEVFPVGAITAGRKGEQLAEMANMARGGAVAFSDDGCCVPSAELLKQAMLYAKMLGKPIMEHCEEPSLTAGGVMNECFTSTKLGLPGIPGEAEEIIVARDIYLARLTGAHLHVQHISTRGTVELIRRAKQEGIHVTAEVCPHHLTLTEEALNSFNPVFKVAPPLRSQDDVDACIEALRDGTIDVIASDHAPHLREEKELELAFAPCGLIGLETTLGVLLTKLVAPGKLSFERLIEALTIAPSKVLNLGRGTLQEGHPGNVTVIDLGLEWEVDPDKFRSKSRNCPWAGEELCGKAVATVVGGELVYEE